MTLPTNVLQTVQTYNKANLAFLTNDSPLINIANKKFKDFQNIQGQLGTTVGFEKPPRFTTVDSLVASFAPSEQLVHTLTVDQQTSTSFAFNVQQFIYNVRDYMDRFGKAAVKSLGAKVERNVGLNAINHTYRCFGDGNTAITSAQQLAQMLALYRNYGSANGDVKVIIPDTYEPAIVNSMFNQFALNRNNEQAQSWEIGNWNGVKWYRSNLLPTHTAGTAGQEGQQLTVVSTTKDSNNNITAITFSGVSASDSDCLKAGDIITFEDINFLQWIGYGESASKVQVRVTANAASTGGSQVTASIYPALVYVQGSNQNIASDITAGLLANVANSHKVGWVIGGDSFFLAMPRLPEEVPYPTANQVDEDTGVSISMYYG
jgi:hypothetical protein